MDKLLRIWEVQFWWIITIIIVIITNNHEGLQELITAENTEKIKCLRPKQTKTPTLWSLAFLRRYAQ